jgi:hypothetical protein
MSEKDYKFLVIDTNSHDAILLNSYKSIEDFLDANCNNKLSHNTIRQRLLDNKFFFFEDVIIKKLIWE